MRPLALAIVFLAAAVSTAAAEVVFERSEEGEDVPFEFKLDKIEFEYDGCSFSGRIVSAESDRLVKNLTAIFTALDGEGGFLGRNRVQIGEYEEAAEVGYVDQCTIDTNKKIPAKIVWQIKLPPSYDDLEVLENSEQTSEDIPLVFELQRVGTGYDGLRVWGIVRNASTKTYENVGVIVSIHAADGSLLGRGRNSASPSKIGPGQIGYVDALDVNVENRKPAKLLWKVVSGESYY
jgi:hypothetical protein